MFIPMSGWEHEADATDKVVTAATGAPADSRSTTIDELLVLIGGGDRLAFEQLYLVTAPRLFGLIKRILRDHSQSEEVGQEVYLEIWQTASRFQRSKGRGLSWMFTMAHRRAIDRVRASQSSRDRDLRIGMRDRDTEHDSVAEKVDLIFEGDRIRAAMAGLTVLQREAIELTYFGGLTQTELADFLGVSINTAKTRLRDGLIRLRKMLTT